MELNLKKISRSLSWLLRHCPDYIEPEGGWAFVQDVVSVLGKQYPGFSQEHLLTIVREDKKMRYSFDDTGQRIRANQGHSVPGVVVEMREVESVPDVLYHGTATRYLPHILKEGLRPMSRQYVHISNDPTTARKVGSRHGKPVVLLIRARELTRDGYKLKMSANGVWQIEEVPPEYISVLEEGSTNGVVS